MTDEILKYNFLLAECKPTFFFQNYVNNYITILLLEKL